MFSASMGKATATPEKLHIDTKANFTSPFKGLKVQPHVSLAIMDESYNTIRIDLTYEQAQELVSKVTDAMKQLRPKELLTTK